jgi:hypothetical protein
MGSTSLTGRLCVSAIGLCLSRRPRLPTLATATAAAGSSGGGEARRSGRGGHGGRVTAGLAKRHVLRPAAPGHHATVYRQLPRPRARRNLPVVCHACARHASLGPRGVGYPAPRIGLFCAEPSWSTRAPRARRPPREDLEWPSYGHYGRPTARWRHHGTRTSAHGHPRAVPSPGGAGSRRPRPRIRPPPKKNSKTLIAPRTPELTD